MRGLFAFSVVLCPTLVVACGARTGLGGDVFADASVLFDSTTEDRADVRVSERASP
jgi:predicted small secreted protein